MRILERAQLTDWKIGKSRVSLQYKTNRMRSYTLYTCIIITCNFLKVFLRYYHKEKLNSLLHTHERSASIIQKVFRGYKCRERYVKILTHYVHVDMCMLVLHLQLLATEGEANPRETQD